MTQSTDQNIIQFDDLSATDFKRHFGRTLDEVLQGRAVRITRHGRDNNRLVLIREADLKRLGSPAVHPLGALRAQFDALLERMQSEQAREAVQRVNQADSEALGAAALEAFRKGG